MRVGEFATALLAMAKPLEPLDLPLLDSHGATLAEEIRDDSRVVLPQGVRIRSTQIGLAATLGLDHLPTRPQPRVVVVSLSESESMTSSAATNSWLLTTAVKEAGALGYRVFLQADTAAHIKAIIEDQLVRADLVLVTGDEGDRSFDQVLDVLNRIGEMTSVDVRYLRGGRHAYGAVGPEKTPIVLLPGHPISAYISTEIFVRPMIRQMMGLQEIHRPTMRAILNGSINSTLDFHQFVLGMLERSETGDHVRPLEDQEHGLVGRSERAHSRTFGREREEEWERSRSDYVGASVPVIPAPTEIVSASGRVLLRPLRLRDKQAWLELRRRNHDWLKPWEATSPNQIHFDPPRYWELVRFQRKESRAIRSLAMMIWVDGEMVGQINLGGIAFGALRGANIGYWIDQGHSNRGITTEAVITLTEYAFVELRLHRIEIAFRPENDASKRVAEKSGYSYEGLRPRFLHIDGQWRDHIIYVRENPRID